MLVVEVLVVAQHHADRRIDHLGRDAVANLLGQARFGVPSTAVQLLELGSEDADLLGRLAGRRHQAHRHGFAHPLDDEDVAHPLAAVDESRGPIPPLGVDVIDIGAGGLGDVRVGGDDRGDDGCVGHAVTLPHLLAS